MPELVEVEAYRALAAARALDREIVEVDAPDAWFVKGPMGPADLREALLGRRLVAARRRGKLALLDLDDGHVLGVRFGMTGRLVVDEEAGVGELLYTSMRDLPAWDRFGVRFADGGRLRVNDPRRLGGVQLDPDVGALGPDAATVSLRELRAALAGSRAPIKAALLDQGRLAGIGNLLGDELLWRARLGPLRPAGGLEDDELRRLHRAVRSTVAALGRRGGSHLGDLMEARAAGGRCPRCGTATTSATVGGRTTWWCPACQPPTPGGAAGARAR